MFSEQDRFFMDRALQIAAQGMYSATPNPRVGCVLVKDGLIVSEGWHRKTGEPHAEALALAQAGDRARGTTAYVTLEPCAHQGRTPPCASALVEAKVTRVIAAMEDPNPLVSGQGFGRLRDAGIEVRCGLFEHEARELNIGFVSRMSRGRPWVRMKLAASLDGITALANGQSQWITSEAARLDGHRWRARACAILTGMGTVKQDNPLLNVRGVATPRQPVRVLVDSRLELNPAAQIVQSSCEPEQGALWVLSSAAPGSAQEVALKQASARLEVFHLPADAQGKNDLTAAVNLLGQRGINELHVEAGYKLNGSLIKAGLVDEILLYLAPRLLGQGQGLAALGALDNLKQSSDWQIQDSSPVGPDLRIILRRPNA